MFWNLSSSYLPFLTLNNKFTSEIFSPRSFFTVLALYLGLWDKNTSFHFLLLIQVHLDLVPMCLSPFQQHECCYVPFFWFMFPYKELQRLTKILLMVLHCSLWKTWVDHFQKRFKGTTTIRCFRAHTREFLFLYLHLCQLKIFFPLKLFASNLWKLKRSDVNTYQVITAVCKLILFGNFPVRHISVFK